MTVKPNYTLVGINYAPEPTGNAPYNAELAEELARNGSITVLTGVPHYPWWKKQKPHSDKEYLESHPGIRLLRRNHYVPKQPSNLRRAIMELCFGLNCVLSGQIKGSKVILVSPALLSSVVVLAWTRIRRPKTRVLLWVQDLYEQGLKETSAQVWALSKVVTIAENWLLSASDAVVVAHPGFLESKKIQSSQKVQIAIQNWSQFEFKPSEAVFDTKKRLELVGRKAVLHIGNMGVKQGLSSVIAAARLAVDLENNIQFIFVGGGNQFPSLIEESKGLDNVTIIPPVSETELSNILQAADILLVHEKEGVKEMSIPSKMTTYFQVGIPVLVCSDKESLAAKTVIDNNIGFWVASGNPAALLNSINTLDLAEGGKIASKAREFAKLNYTREAALARFKSVLENL